MNYFKKGTVGVITLLIFFVFASNANAASYITNGHFSTDLSGWTVVSGSVAHNAGLNTVQFTGNGGTNLNDNVLTQNVTGYTVGNTLTVTYDVIAISGAFGEIDIYDGSNVLATSGTLNTTGSNQTFTVTPTTSSVTIRVRANGTSGSTIDFDNINVEWNNTAPTITSGSTFDIDENTTAVGTITATDPDAGQTITYRILPESESTNSKDWNKVTIDSSTGVLTMNSAPDYENPDDANGDARYEIVVGAKDNDSSNPLEDTELIYITVKDVEFKMSSAKTGDADGDGFIDFVDVTLSLDLNASSLDANGGDFAVSNSGVGNFTVTGATETSPGVVRIVFDEVTSNPGGKSGAIVDVGLLSGKTLISTPSTGSEEMNNSQTGSAVTATDGAKPVFSITYPVTPNPTSDNTPEIRFTDYSEDGVMSVSGGCTLSEADTSNSGGVVTLGTASSPMNDGTYNCTLTLTDSAGNASDPVAIPQFTIDTTRPTVTVNQKTTQNDPTNASKIYFDVIFSEPIDPTFNGFGGASFNFNTTGTLQTNAPTLTETSGGTNTNFDLVVDVTGEGTLTVTLDANQTVDGASNLNEASVSTDNSVTRDTTPPNKPTAIPDLVASSDTGVSNTDNVTNDTTPEFDITACTPGAALKIYANSTAIGADTCQASGTATVATAFSTDGTYNITFTEFDNVGNESEKSDPLSVTIDSTAPSAPTVTDITDDTGASNSDAVTNDATLIFGGGNIGGDVVSVEVFANGSSIGTVSISSGTTWSFDYTGTTLSSGTYAITAKSKDLAGNASVASAAKSVVVDTLNPAIASVSVDTPVIKQSDLTQKVTVTYVEEMDTSVNPTINFVSTANFSLTSDSWDATKKIYTAVFTHDGTPETTLGETVSVSGGKDIAGNTELGGPISSSAFDVRTDAPATPTTAPDLVASSDTGVSDSDNITGDNTPTFTLKCADANNSVQLYKDGVQEGSAVSCVASGGTISADVTTAGLPSNAYNFTYREIDTYGNESADSPALQVHIDILPPTVTVDVKSGQANPTANSPAVFTVVFNETIQQSLLTASDFTITTNGNVIAGVPTLQEVAPLNGTTFELTVPFTNTGVGSISASLVAGRTKDLVGLNNLDSTSTNNTVNIIEYEFTISVITNGQEPSTNTVFEVMVSPTNNSGAALTGDVTFSGTATEGTDYQTGPTTFSIPDGSGTAQFTLTTIDDTAQEGMEKIRATISNPSKGRIASAWAEADLGDNDTAGVSVSAISGNVAESGTTATFTMVLNTQPTADVTIAISSSDTGEVTISPASVTFTSANWSTPQTVTVTGVDDSVVDGDQTVTIQISPAVSTDANYNGFDPSDVTATNTDNDTATSGTSGGGGGGGVWTGNTVPTAPSTDQEETSSQETTQESTQTPTGQVLGVSTFRFNNNMSIYLNNRLSPDITKLQERLTEEGVYNGPITGFFGPLTRAAVIRYQEKYGITPAVGYVGPITREQLNSSQPSDTLTPEQREAIQRQINELLALVQALMKQLEELGRI